MATFGVQLKYLLYRNYRLKIKDKKTLFQEFFVPCIFVLSLLSFTFTLKPKVYQAWPYSAFQSHTLLGPNATGDFLPEVAANRSWAFTPDSVEARAVLAALRQALGPDNVPDPLLPFASEAEMVEAYRSAAEPAFSLGLVFGQDFPQVPEVAIRMPYESVPSTDSAGLFASPVACREWGLPGLWRTNCPANQYLYSGFAVLQTVLQNSVASMLSNQSLAMPDFAVRMFPKAAYTQPASTTRVIASVYYVIMFSVYITVLLNYMVYEKEKKIKETMLIMGMSSWAFWLAWLITYMIIILVVSLVIALLSKYAVQTVPNGNFLIIFLIMFFYGVSIIGLAFMLTPFFNKALVAGVAGAILTLLLSLVYIPLGLIAGVPTVYKWLLSFLSPIAFSLAMDQAISLDGDTGGIQFDNLSLDGFPPYLAMLAIDAVLYFLLAIYFDNVVPGNYGQSKPLLFFLMPSFWCRGKEASQPRHAEEYHEVVVDLEDVEPVPPVLKDRAAIRIRNLVKTFKGGKKKPDVHAVKGMTLDIYEGQITCLLGHNGAGKTTLINMLTGLVPASAGKASVYGRSVRDPLQMAEIRSSLGICSQDNTLIEVLSAREHLTFYAGLKGVPPAQIDAQVDKSLRQCLLHDVADTASKDLSGGQKRKLCVGIALIGDPKVVFLDEPSSGMDPYSRRQLWNLLKSQRQGRVTVLTTHFMDEADILADRKAMMSKGNLRCCGSSLFLKTRFGIGYHLGMVVDQEADIEPITDLVKQHVPLGNMSRHNAMELTYTLPLQDADRFPDLFRALEAGSGGDDTVARQLGIQMYGVHMTTLEEVFLKLLDDECDDSEDESGNASVSDMAPINNASGRDSNTQGVGSESVSLDVQHLISKPLDPTKYQLRALCVVLLRQMIRNPETYVSRLFFPILYMVIAVVLASTINFGGSTISDPTSLALVPELYVETSSSMSSSLTPLLYQDNLTGGQDISSLVGQFDSLGLTSDSIVDMSDLMTLAPHSLATVALDLGTDASQNETASFVALYNDTAVHSLPALLGLLGNALVPLQTAAQTVVNVTVSSHPLPPRGMEYTFNPGFFLALFLAMAFTFMPLGFATNSVKERQEKIRTQLRVSGVTTRNYWMSHFLIDCFQMYFLSVVGVIILSIMGAALSNVSFSQGGAIFMFVLFMLVFSPMMVMYSYCIGFLFDDYKTCQSFAPLIFYYVPYIFMAPLLGLDYTGNSTPAAAIHLVSSIICPHYSIYGMFYYIDKVYQVALVTQQLDQLTFADYFAFDNMLVPTLLCVLVTNVLVFFLLRFSEIVSTGGRWSDTCMWSQGKFGTVRPNQDSILNEDSDVEAERAKVQEIFDRGIPQEGCVMAASGVRKEFPRKGSSGGDGCFGSKSKGKANQPASTTVAVRNLSLSVAEGEVLGLLGPNGAGKTTSMNVITADTKATNGQIQIGGHNITSSLSEAFHSMGFCPQHDPLYEAITMREHIETYALLKGIHPDDVGKVATHYMEALKVMEHADKKSEKLSGGTKRKLCFAMSMLGMPKIVFMDEPSTGMDPTSKRFVWNTIIASFHEKRGCVLTTHSMEEADAVCSRVAIMISGKLVCLGTTQHLKSKYGEGYVLEVKLNPGQDYYTLDHSSAEARQLLETHLAKLEVKVRQIFPRAEVNETFGERVIYRIPREGALQLSAVFAELEQGKETLSIEEYSFSQATLEQVFIEFAKTQRDEDGNEAMDVSPKHRSVDIV